MTTETGKTGYPYVTGVAHDIANWVRNLGPSGAAGHHFRTARLEVLKGLRQVIDNRIAHIDHSRNKGTSVPVE